MASQPAARIPVAYSAADGCGAPRAFANVNTERPSSTCRRCVALWHRLVCALRACRARELAAPSGITMQSRITALFLLLTSVTTFAPDARGHHNANAFYDFSRVGEVEGRVANVRWNNPHVI